MSDLPQPLTPPECDLRGLEWMPFYGHRLFASDFDAHASDAIFRAALNLMWAAWNQMPAASLPDDDIALCRLAGLGRQLKRWRGMRDQALEGFELCADYRLYHRELAPIALDSWRHRQRERARRKRWKDKAARGDVPEDVPETADRTRPDSTGQDWTQPPSTERRSATGLRPARAGDLGLVAAMRPGASAAAGKRLKPPERADRDMVLWLTTEGGLNGEEAWGVLFAARDPDDKDHAKAARQLERISREHRLGWFAGETEAA
jgi:hypothetical protein